MRKILIVLVGVMMLLPMMVSANTAGNYYMSDSQVKHALQKIEQDYTKAGLPFVLINTEQKLKDDENVNGLIQAGSVLPIKIEEYTIVHSGANQEWTYKASENAFNFIYSKIYSTVYLREDVKFVNWYIHEYKGVSEILKDRIKGIEFNDMMAKSLREAIKSNDVVFLQQVKESIER